MRITRIFLQPVKSLRGYEVDEAEVDELGMVGDRRFLVVDEEGRFLTQRALPRMARVTARLQEGSLRLNAPGAEELPVGLSSDGAVPAPLRQVTIWKSEGLAAEDCGPEPARWLTGALGMACRLVRVGPKFARPIPPHRVPEPLRSAGPRVAFTDAFPFMIIGEASLDELNGRLAEEGHPAVPMERFRPSFTFTGAEPFAEDRWETVKAGGVVLHLAGGCARCIMTCTDPWTGERGDEPLRLLATYRRDPAEPSKVMFGQNAVHAPAPHSQRLRVGDKLEPVLRRG